MVTETAQILSTACHILHHKVNNIYKPTHVNHPCIIWTAAHVANFDWLIWHGLALGNEYQFRYGKQHKSTDVILNIAHSFSYIGYSMFNPDFIYPFVQCMPQAYKTAFPIQSYRLYYMHEKSDFAKWNKGRDKPHWWNLS